MARLGTVKSRPHRAVEQLCHYAVHRSTGPPSLRGCANRPCAGLRSAAPSPAGDRLRGSFEKVDELGVRFEIDARSPSARILARATGDVGPPRARPSIVRLDCGPSAEGGRLSLGVHQSPRSRDGVVRRVWHGRPRSHQREVAARRAPGAVPRITRQGGGVETHDSLSAGRSDGGQEHQTQDGPTFQGDSRAWRA